MSTTERSGATPERPVVVVGAGLAGLAAAVHLHEAGVPVLVVEASDRPGGRVRTDTVDGFRLDRGFQVYLDAYPEGRRMLGLDEEPAAGAPELHPFLAGADIRAGARTHRLADPFRHPGMGLRSVAAALSGQIFTLRDVLRTILLKTTLRRHFSGRGGTPGLERPAFPEGQPTTLAFLRDSGYSERAIERFWRPFLGGIFLERELVTPASMFAFVFSMFDTGRATLPAGGMEAIPRALVRRLPADAVRTGLRVTGIRGDHVLAVPLDPPEAAAFDASAGPRHEHPPAGDPLRIEAAAVVVATDRSHAAALAGHGGGPEQAETHGWNGTCCLWYAAERSPVDDPIIVLNAEEDGTAVGDGPVRHLCVHSRVAPGYAPAGAELLCLSTIGVPRQDEPALQAAVRHQMEAWFGPSAAGWRHLRTDRIPHALPRVVHREAVHETGRYHRADGAVVAGDHLENASINGAMISGRVAAAEVRERLGADRGIEPTSIPGR